jgi:hypothetical protein
MNNISMLASEAIDRAKNLQEFAVFRDMDDIVFCGSPIPYTLNHVMGQQVEITVPAISQAEAEQRVNKWIEEMRNAE